MLRRLIGNHYQETRTGIKSNTIFNECKLGTVTLKRLIERLDASGIANDQCGAGVENRFGFSHHFRLGVAFSYGDLIKERLPITLTWYHTRVRFTITRIFGEELGKQTSFVTGTQVNLPL